MSNLLFLKINLNRKNNFLVLYVLISNIVSNPEIIRQHRFVLPDNINKIAFFVS